MEIHLVPARFSQVLVFCLLVRVAVTSSLPICNIVPKRVLLRRESKIFSATTLASLLQLMPNPLRGAVEWVRDYELREAGWYKVDFHLSRASASVSALIFKEKRELKREKRSRRGSWDCFMALDCSRKVCSLVGCIDSFVDGAIWPHALTFLVL